MIFSFSLLNLIRMHTLFIADQPRWHHKDILESKSIINQQAQLTRRKTKDHSSPSPEIQTGFTASLRLARRAMQHRRITVATQNHCSTVESTVYVETVVRRRTHCSQTRSSWASWLQTKSKLFNCFGFG